MQRVHTHLRRIQTTSIVLKYDISLNFLVKLIFEILVNLVVFKRAL